MQCCIFIMQSIYISLCDVLLLNIWTQVSGAFFVLASGDPSGFMEFIHPYFSGLLTGAGAIIGFPNSQ